MALKLRKIFWIRLLTIQGTSGVISADLAQEELRTFRQQLAAYPEQRLDELKLRLEEAEVLGMRKALERHIRDRAAMEVTRLTFEAQVMAAEASANG
ncbi:hypothetical protein [Roseomonas indoligenes]|uniref:Uncharacterized protein n=1 Tax=Roseomonas indoligenes TaxID=2820811 RepID=A0A940N1Y9_9PROT|nr:hypothetical protein [Pararoseomonas indoligenes]MBP0495743.1 hypothetical protein [Pararoseomonas indoligenes]